LPPLITRRSFNVGATSTALYPLLPSSAKALADKSPTIANSPVTVTRSQIAYLIAEDSLYPSSLTVKLERGVPGIKRFWVENWRDPEQTFKWKVQVEHAGKYEVTFMVSAPPGTPIVVEGAHGKLSFEATQPGLHGYYWDRITLPTPLHLPKGESTISVDLLKRVTEGWVGAALKSIELLDVKARPGFDARIKAFRSDASWLTDAKFGLMCQCGEWSYPPQGPHKAWPEMVDRFDVQKFVDLVESTGAGYAVWSATWATYFFPAPIHAIDEIMPGRTCKRDLIGEMADALASKNLRLILYYHLGHDQSPENGSWWSKNWVSTSDKSLFIKNWCSILTEVGQRYGDRLAGWMFDDELIYYPMPYELVGAAAKAGSPRRIISYNAWIQARGTDFQDFQFGEGFRGSADLPESAHGIWPAGPMKGLQAHGNFQIDGPNWGINRPDETITPPLFSAEKAVDFAMVAAQHNEALSWNLEMYDDGSVSKASLEVFQQAGDAVRKLYPKKQPPGA
jgi:Alpha-L-fucosidase